MLGGDVAKRQRDPPDMTLIVMLITLTGIGLGVLLSASHYYGQRVFGDPLYFVRRQTLFILIGTVSAVIASRIDSDKLKRFAIPIMALSALLMVLTTIESLGGSRPRILSWLSLRTARF